MDAKLILVGKQRCGFGRAVPKHRDKDQPLGFGCQVRSPITSKHCDVTTQFHLRETIDLNCKLICFCSLRALPLRRCTMRDDE